MAGSAADMGTRNDLLARLEELIRSSVSTRPTRVAIDGRPAAGKTTLADELADLLRSHGCDVIRATIEGFLLPQAQRYRRGVDSPEGCYDDSFDLDALRDLLLDPLGPDGNRMIQRAVYDRDTDAPLSLPVSAVGPDAVLLFDGVFLLRPELIDSWDVRIFVSVAFDEALARARVRDHRAMGSAERVEQRFRDRYKPSQQRYLETVRPVDHADIVVYNDDPLRPAWEHRGRGTGQHGDVVS